MGGGRTMLLLRICVGCGLFNSAAGLDLTAFLFDLSAHCSSIRAGRLKSLPAFGAPPRF
jgi:hypothetical protein